MLFASFLFIIDAASLLIIRHIFADATRLRYFRHYFRHCIFAISHAIFDFDIDYFDIVFFAIFASPIMPFADFRHCH
jgi:hypothetical protein